MARRRARRRGAARSGHSDRHRRAHARPQRPRRPAPLPHGPRRRARGIDDRAGRGSRRRARERARRRSRAGHRIRRRGDRGRRARRRRCLAGHRSVGRRAAPALGPGRAAGRHRGEAVVRGTRVDGLVRVGLARRRRGSGVDAREGVSAGGRGGGVPRRPRGRTVLGRAAAAPPARVGGRGVDGRTGARLRRAAERCVSASRPDAAEGQPPGPRRRRGRERADRACPRPGARQLRRRRDDRRHDLRPARRPVRAPARARYEGLEGRRPPGRPLLCTRDHRDPHPRADPGQAGGRCRGPEPRSAHGDARRHLRRRPGLCEPALGLAREGHLGERRVDRPGPDAAPPDRRHHGLGEVWLHQHASDVDPAPCDARGRADDPHRPEADRAELLRVDPAPPDAGRVEPEGGVRRPPQRRRRDGAALRAPLDRARAEPPRGEPHVPGTGRGPAPVPPRRDRRARRPHDDLAAGGRGRDHPPCAEVARRGHPPRPRDAAARPWTSSRG